MIDFDVVVVFYFFVTCDDIELLYLFPTFSVWSVPRPSATEKYFFNLIKGGLISW